MSLTEGFIYGGDTGDTLDDLKRRREMARLMMASRRAPRNVGEGLDSFGKSIAGALIARAAHRESGELQADNELRHDEAVQRTADLVFGNGSASASFPADTGNVADMDPIDATVSRAHNAQRDGFEGNIESDLLSSALKARGAQVSPRDNIRNNPERDILAGALHAEAGSEGPTAMGYVGNVMKNRVASPDFPNTFEGVFKQPGQFSPYNSTSGYAGGEQGNEQWRNPSAEAYRVADQVMSGALPDATGGALNFYNPNISQPSWGNSSFARLPGTQHVFGGGNAPARASTNDYAQNNMTREQFAQALDLSRSPDAAVASINKALVENHLKGLQPRDPEEMLDLKIKQAQLEQLMNPTPKKSNRQIMYEEYVRAETEAGRNPMSRNDWHRNNEKASATTVNVGPSEKKEQEVKGTAWGEAQNKIFDDAEAAMDTIASLEVMENAMNAPGFYSGSGADQVMTLKRLGVALGGDPDGISDMETFSAETKKAILAAMGGSLGAGFSEGDRVFVEGQSPGLANTPEGNRKLIEIAKRVQTRKIETAKHFQDWYASQEAEGKPTTRMAWAEEVRSWRKENPAFGDMEAEKEAPAKARVGMKPRIGIEREFNGRNYRYKGGDPKDINNWEKL